MSNHLRALGFPIDALAQLQELAYMAVEQGDVIASPSGSYIRWRAFERAELWVAADADGQLVAVTPTWRGELAITLEAPARLLDEDTPLEGALADDALAVQLADVDLVARDAPRCEVCVTAFAHDLELVPEREGSRAGLTRLEHEQLAAFAAVEGELVSAQQRLNPIARGRFWHLKVRLDGDRVLDVLAASGQVRQRPRPGKWVRATAWLSGARRA